MTDPASTQALEPVIAHLPAGVTASGSSLSVATVQPTQVRRPWRSTGRTVFQALVGLCVLAPILVQTTGLEVEQLPWLGGVLAVAAGVTRVMALPGVEQWLRRFLPFLAAAPAQPKPPHTVGEHRREIKEH